MRLITFPILTILLSCENTPKKATSDLERLHLKGNVSNILETGTYWHKYQVSFFENGNIAREEFSYPQTVVNYRYKDGKLVRTETFSIPDPHSSSDKQMTLHAQFKYNNKRQLIETVEVRISDQAKFSTKFEYDPNGRLIRQDGFKFLYTISYNENGNVIKKDEYLYLKADRHERALNYSKIFEYDSAGKTIKELKYLNDPAKRPIERKFEYNQNNDTIEILTTNNNRTTITNFEYEYDSIGNWTKKVEYKNDTIIRELKRSIYYRKD